MDHFQIYFPMLDYCKFIPHAKESGRYHPRILLEIEDNVTHQGMPREEFHSVRIVELIGKRTITAQHE